MKANTNPLLCIVVSTSFILTHLRHTNSRRYASSLFTFYRSENRGTDKLGNFPKVTRHSSSRSCALTTLLPDILKRRKNKKLKNNRI